MYKLLRQTSKEKKKKILALTGRLVPSFLPVQYQAWYTKYPKTKSNFHSLSEPRLNRLGKEKSLVEKREDVEANLFFLFCRGNLPFFGGGELIVGHEEEGG